MNRHSLGVTLVSAAFGAAMLLGGASSAAAAELRTIIPIPPQPVDENQFFRGLVNGQTGAGRPAVVRMACFGPFRPGETGHPLGRQTLEVIRELHPLPGFPDVGFTGSQADSIQVDFETALPDSTPEESIVLNAYNVPIDIPTSLVFPCDGAGTVNFTPSPTGTFAKTASVPVEFVGQP